MWITNSNGPTNNPQGNKEKAKKKDNFDFKLQDSLNYWSVYLKQQINANKDAAIPINISPNFFGLGFIISEDNKLKLLSTFSQKV